MSGRVCPGSASMSDTLASAGLESLQVGSRVSLRDIATFARRFEHWVECCFYYTARSCTQIAHSRILVQCL